jgi:hypothetical protein
MNDISTKPNGGVVSPVARVDLWMFLMVAASLGWLMWPRSREIDRRGKPGAAALRTLSRSERNLLEQEPMAGYGA